MTVEELIKQLKKEDQKAKVFLINCDTQFEEAIHIRKVDGEKLSGNFPKNIIAISEDLFYQE